ncbi:MAG: hypothetical protein EPN43_07665 [Jatrophihabitans sp.]|nr:MAG: hypothetical protein EPN43_07665 [Jatrophihabitans sp.]
MLGRRGRLWQVTAAACAALVLAGCAQVVRGTGSRATAPDAALAVTGASGSPFDVAATNALADVMDFWRVQYPKVSGGHALPPLKGGLFSVDGNHVVRTGAIDGPAAKEACASRKPAFIVDNAAFCLLDDSIIWDRAPNHLIGVLFDRYGPLLMGLVFAHEFGHAIQFRVGPNDNVPTVLSESQADCAAGAWVASALAGDAPHFPITPADLDRALNGYLQVRDSPPTSTRGISHGNGFDRISAIADGIAHGAAYCFDPAYLTRTITERPYTTDSDYAAGGNQSIGWIAEKLPPDLNRFWAQAAASVGRTWQPVALAQADHPRCAPNGPSQVGYCPDDNTVYLSADYAKTAYYSLTDRSIDRQTGDVTLVPDQAADFALGTVLVIAWGMAVRHQLFDRSLQDTAALRAASCYAGAYARTINVGQGQQPGEILLSPPDMDEATSAMLNLVGTEAAFGARGTTGLQRVQDFVTGYTGGLPAC